MKEQHYNCNRCGIGLAPFITHIRLDVTMSAGPTLIRRYCVECCADPSMAILFADVMSQPVVEMHVRKVFW